MKNLSIQGINLFKSEVLCASHGMTDVRAVKVTAEWTECHLFWQVSVIQGGKKVSTLPINYEASAVSVSPGDGETHVAVGGSTDNKVKSPVVRDRKTALSRPNFFLLPPKGLFRTFKCFK